MVTAAAQKRRTALPESKQRLRLWIRILRTARAIEAEVRERLRIQFGVTLPQFDVMAALERRPNGMTMTELSRFLMVSNGNVTGIVDRLVNDKLVIRTPGAEDRRSFLVRLAPKGLRDFNAMAKAHEGWVDELLSEFNTAEADILIGHLDGLSSRIRNGGTRA
jgi:DNA-binding MarR family transcriptional regulator